MADPSRPVAPILPREVISRIFAAIPLNEYFQESDFARFATVHRSWTELSQQRLFTILFFKSASFLPGSESKIPSLVDDLQPRLMQHIVSLSIEHYGPEEGCSRVIFLVLQSSTNLKKMKLKLPASFAFEAHEVRIMKSQILLPRLIDFEISSCDNSLDSIISTAPNLEKLTFGISGPYTGSRCTSHLHNLKEFTIFDGRSLEAVEGKLWSVTEFRGLEVLEVKRNPIRVDVATFFAVIAPSLLELKIPYTFSNQLFAYLSNLQRIEVLELNDEEQLLALPRSITHLKVKLCGTARNISSSSWSHLENLSTLEIGTLGTFFDFSQLPPLQKLIIRNDEKCSILRSLETMKSVKFGELILEGYSRYCQGGQYHKAYYAAEQLVSMEQRCAELNINLRSEI